MRDDQNYTQELKFISFILVLPDQCVALYVGTIEVTEGGASKPLRKLGFETHFKDLVKDLISTDISITARLWYNKQIYQKSRRAVKAIAFPGKGGNNTQVFTRVRDTFNTIDHHFLHVPMPCPAFVFDETNPGIAQPIKNSLEEPEQPAARDPDRDFFNAQVEKPEFPGCSTALCTFTPTLQVKDRRG